MKYIPANIKYLSFVYLIGIFFFTTFRIIFWFSAFPPYYFLPYQHWHFWMTLYNGWLFDNQVSGAFLFFPFLMLTFAEFYHLNNKWTLYTVSTIIITLYLIAFLICSIDTPYFKYSYSHISLVIFNWMDNSGTVVKMIIQEFGLWFYSILFLATSAAFIIILRFLKKKLLNQPSALKTFNINKDFTSKLLIYLLFFIAILLGIRGGVISALSEENITFTHYAFPKQAVMNPIIPLFKSAFVHRYFIDNHKAIKNVQNYLHILYPEYSSPIARKNIPLNSTNKKLNVVLVIMESMSAEKMSRYGNQNHLTPFLDSLARSSWCFDHFYSSGKHTYSGLYSTLYSFPVIWSQKPLKPDINIKYSGLSGTLKDNGYQTIYFTCHDEFFDDVGEFLTMNYFDKIISKKDYPKEKIISTFGVPDDYLFEYAVPKLTDLSEKNNPFLAVLLTISDHPPYTMPKNIPFTPKSKDIKNQMTEYADWSIKKFIHLCSNESWFNNTLFVFVADHGAVIGNNIYDLPLSYHHIPLIIYSPELTKEPKVFDQLGSQTDIYPTIMRLLKLPYVNNTLGINQFSEHRPYVFFSSDTKMGCLDKDFFYVIAENGKESLYKLKDSSAVNHMDAYKSKLDSMKTYMFSNLQTTQWIIFNHLTGKLK